MNSEYRHYFKRQFGLKESQLPPSIVERDAYPGIDPEELEMGTEDEAGEHDMSPEKAEKTAAQHLQEPNQGHYYSGMEKAKRQGMLKDMLMGKTPSPADQLVNPTAIPIPIIGVAVRGSSTGGLPSRADQMAKNITPTNLGGYQKVPLDPVNSKLIDKTPTNPDILQHCNPIVDNPALTGGVTHPHQVQNDSNEPPQAVTGASTDSDDSLTLKSAVPNAVDIDVSEQDKNLEPVADDNPQSVSPNKEGERDGMMNETFARHMKLMLDSKLTEGKHKAGCTCGFCKNKGSFGKKKTEEEKEPEKEEVEEKKEVDEAVTQKYSAPFERMRGLAGIGDMTLSSNGIWECATCGCGKPSESHEPGASHPFNTHWKMDKEKAGMVKVDEVTKGKKCTKCGCPLPKSSKTTLCPGCAKKK